MTVIFVSKIVLSLLDIYSDRKLLIASIEKYIYSFVLNLFEVSYIIIIVIITICYFKGSHFRIST